MWQAVTASEALPTRFRRVLQDGSELWRTGYFGPAPSPPADRLVNGVAQFVEPADPYADAPQAFLVEQGPGATVPPHFHYVNQFQVVIAGSGRLGARAVAPLAIHYAGAHTAYGPIAAGPHGLAYFTLRAQSDTTGAQFLPESRARMKPVPRRYLLVDVPGDRGEAPDADRSAEKLVEEPDGLAVFVSRFAPGESRNGPDPALGGGQAWLLLEGEVEVRNRVLSRFGCLYLSRDEPALVPRAGTAGADMLVLQFPRPPSGAG
jgi:hypothetical protein